MDNDQTDNRTSLELIEQLLMAGNRLADLIATGPGSAQETAEAVGQWQRAVMHIATTKHRPTPPLRRAATIDRPDHPH